MPQTRLLFVDDEQNIRLTLPAILTSEGFDVSVAATVPEALQMIQSKTFDILLSDLNIGEPGDGFTVVSAMRRVQPQAATFILTGYPDFESALKAIRNQVDDYLTKPVDIRKLVQVLRDKSERPTSEKIPPVKRVSAILREHHSEIVERWYERVIARDEISSIRISRKERVDHVPGLLLEIAERIEKHPSRTSDRAMKAAEQHGILRSEQGYAIPMMLVESSILEKTLSELLQDHLLTIDISTLILDLCEMSQAINCAIETSVRAFLDRTPEPMHSR